MTHGNTDDVREQPVVTNRKLWTFQRGWAAPCQPWFRIYRWSPEHMPYWGYWGLVLGKREYRLWWDSGRPSEKCGRSSDASTLVAEAGGQHG